MHLEWRSVCLPLSVDGAPSPGMGLVSGPPILTSVTADETAELQRLAKGRRVLEIGSANGYSACAMVVAGADHVTAIDDHSGATWLGDTRATMEANLAAYRVTVGDFGTGCDVDILPFNSRIAMPELIEEGVKFGLIFIDGDHRLDGATADIEDALQLIEPGGTIAVHDFLEHCCCQDVMYACNRAFPEGPTAVVDTMFVIDR